jgi:hypothetical protein
MTKETIDGIVRLAGIVAIVALIALLGAAGFGWKPGDFAQLGQAMRDDVISTAGDARLIRQSVSERAILIVPRGESGPTVSACAEPPPDASQNIAQTLNAQLSALGRRPEGEASASAQIAQELRGATENLFQRSQGIQLLRDTMFRLCEAFQNGVLPPEQYVAAMTKLIETANFIIPFEQCVGLGRVSSTGVQTEFLSFAMRTCLDTASEFSRPRVLRPMDNIEGFSMCAAAFSRLEGAARDLAPMAMGKCVEAVTRLIDQDASARRASATSMP